MRLLQIGLRNYRNYARLDLEPRGGLNVFLGSNGQGKTNLLESVAMLALSTSPRARREVELIGPLAPECRITALVESGGSNRELEIGIVSDEGRSRRRILVDGVPKRAIDLPGIFRVTLFWPDDLNLVKAGPEHRRRLLNQLLVQVERGYAADLSRYSRVLEQRNSLLKQVAMHLRPPSDLEIWNQELATVGGRLAGARAAAVAELEGLAAAAHLAISGGEELRLQYEGPPEDLLGAVEKALPEDLRRGSTSIGPHRDDVLVSLAGKDARAFASQGQQRTAVVSLKLAEAELIQARTGEPPVLLLDDVLSELDHERRLALMERVGVQGQVIVTSVEAGPFPPRLMVDAVVRCVTAGRIVDCG